MPSNDTPLKTVGPKTYRMPSVQKTCFKQLAATGWGVNMDVSQWRHVMIVLVAENNAGVSGTIQIAGSLQDSNDANLNFATTPSLVNMYDYLSSYDAQEGITAIAGNTGYTFNAAGVKQIMVNTDAIRTLNVNLSAYASGKFTAYVYGMNNQ